MLANGLQTSGPRGLEVGFPSPRAHLSPIQKAGCWLMYFRHQDHVGSRWAAQAREPTFRPLKSPLLANGLQTSGPRGLEVGCPAREPTYRPFKSRMSQMLANGLQTSGPRGFEVGCPSPRALL